VPDALRWNHALPVASITDQRRDKRIDFVGGIRGMKELERRVDSGEMAVAFAVFARAHREVSVIVSCDMGATAQDDQELCRMLSCFGQLR
jgi:uncharacterized protein (DUF1015 family)